MRKMFIERLKQNGHEQIPFLSLNDSSIGHRTTVDERKIFYLSIPFVSDAVDRQVRKAVSALGHNIRVTHKAANLSHILYRPILHPITRNGNCNLTGCKVNDPKLCFTSMVVYEARCNACRQFYLGSTKKFLHTRIQQHFSQRVSHIYQHHSVCNSHWTIKSRCSHNSLQSLRWAEAILIQKEKPTLNRREEAAGLMSFLV